MTPEEQARVVIDEKLEQSGWTIQDMKQLNLTASLGVAVREFPTSTGPVDYALFIEGKPVGVVEAKKSEAGENITVVEGQSARYAGSTFKWVKQEYKIRFAYEGVCSSLSIYRKARTERSFSRQAAAHCAHEISRGL